jgi:hypothetical protein
MSKYAWLSQKMQIFTKITDFLGNLGEKGVVYKNGRGTLIFQYFSKIQKDLESGRKSHQNKMVT